MASLDKTKWYPILENSITMSVLTKTLPTKGNLVYEYNPFRNYRLSKDMFEYDGDLYTKNELETNFSITWETTELDGVTTGNWTKNGELLSDLGMELPILRLKGELVDFITDELNFSLQNPVNIIPQYSYDGSVNLIFNDGVNLPRMINSRFSATGKNTYEIVDRKGSNDTNIYDQGEQFDIDTSLYKRVKQIPKLELLSVTSGGNLKCGNYHFYFKFSDADGNETDFVAESGLVSIFVGEGGPHAIYTGNRNENSVKLVKFLLSNIDPSYSYVNVYYSRYYAEDAENRLIDYKKIDRKFLVNNNKQAKILINGFDDEVDVAREDINLSYNVVDAANCAVTAQSMLFLGNVHKPNIPYEKLTDLSLRFLPYLKEERYALDMDETYSISSTSKGYYDPMYIYNKVGYWDKELYRFGIVYILSNGELSPVFNIRGRENLLEFKGTGYIIPDAQAGEDTFVNSAYDGLYCYYGFEMGEDDEEITIKSNEATNLIFPPKYTSPTEQSKKGNYNISEGHKGPYIGNYENTKGVISIDSSNDNHLVHAIEIRVEPRTIEELKKLGIKGYFFVRLNRMPLTLALGITIGIDKEGRVPTIPTQGGVLDELTTELDGSTYVETKNINGHNYISEGFLSRYKFNLKKKGSSIWSSIGKIALVTAAVAAVAAACVVTFGGAAVGAVMVTTGETIAGALGIGAVSATTATCLAVGFTAAGLAGGVAGAAAIAASNDEIIKAISRATHSVELKGRNTEIRNGYKRVEDEDSRLLGASFRKRIIIKDYTKNDIGGILCPDYDVDSKYYNLLFTGGDFVLKTTKSLAFLQRFIDLYDNYSVVKVGYYFKNDGRHFSMPQNVYKLMDSTSTYVTKLQAVPDGLPCVTIGETKFRSRAGWGEEAWRYECIGDDYKQEPSYYSSDDDVELAAETSTLTEELIKLEVEDKQINSDIVRGNYGPYIGMEDYNGHVGETVSIMIPGYSEALMQEYIQIRMQDVSPFYAISDRYSLDDLENYLLNHSNLSNDTTEDLTCVFPVYRGDCYICQFTHRLNRNFNDAASPYNSDVVDSKSWKEHYKIEEAEQFEKINVGDVNAVNLGMWVTFTVRSNKNLNVRSLDSSVLQEAAEMGHPRGFYPYFGMIAEGSYKSPEALLYNDGFSKNLGERFNFEIPDVPYIRNWYGTRIMYSDIHVNDGYKNGYRVFQGTNYRDYTRLYGSIVKLLNLNDDIFVVFEHGLALIPVNERAVAGRGTGGDVYINTSNVLPEHPKIISESFGSLWADSVIMTPKDGVLGVRIFGVDTCAKKIWMFDGSALKLISDFKVQEFLNNNLTLSEREITPTLGIRNVKTTYNAFKHDVMFTFYDDYEGTQEKVWNLCYNTLLDKFITFYSWVPSFMENINNIPFSFDRNISKWIAKLGQSHAGNSFAEGIVLNNNIYNNDGSIDTEPYIDYRYLTREGDYKTKHVILENADTSGLIGVFNLKEHILPQGDNLDYYVLFELMHDIYGYYKHFRVSKVGSFVLTEADHPRVKNQEIPVFGLFFKEANSSVTDKNTGGMLDTGNIYTGSITGDDTAPLKKTTTNLSGKKELYFAEVFYRNMAGHTYNDFDDYKLTAYEIDEEHCLIPLRDSEGNLQFMSEEKYNYFKDKGYIADTSTYLKVTLDNYFDIVHTLELPIFHARNGARPSIPTPICKQNIVLLLNIKATIKAKFANNTGSDNERTLAEFMNYLKAKEAGTLNNIENESGWFDAGTYESSIAVTSKWNMQFLTSDFWKHGLAGVIDKSDTIFPTKWYGELHPFEFEFIVVDNPGIHKIFLNLEIVANKAKPESFHFEVIGETYDFAPDKKNMYFRLEARKALFQYNGVDITYNSNFLKTSPKLQAKSAELVYLYYERLDTLNDVYDTYNLKKDSIYRLAVSSPIYDFWSGLTPNKDYRHLSGAEIVYYPNRLEYRVWQHLPAINIDDLPLDSATSIIRGNCLYLEDRWEVSINPLLICYKNEYNRKVSGSLFLPENSTWPNAMTASLQKSNAKLPPITIRNTNLPGAFVNFVKSNGGNIKYPGIDTKTYKKTLEGKDNALYGLYSFEGEWPIDNTNWLNDLSIYKTSFGEALNRKETDIRDKFVKVRIRYSGEELAVIDFLNTIYTISYA